MVMSSNILEVMSFRLGLFLSSNSNNCCFLYFNSNIMSSVTKKLQLPRLPTGAPPLNPAGELQSPSLLLCPPNNPVRSMPLRIGSSLIRY